MAELKAIEKIKWLEDVFVTRKEEQHFDVSDVIKNAFSEAIAELEALETKDRLAELEKVILDYYLDKGYKIGADGLGFKVNITTLYKWKLMHVIFLNPKRELVFQIITETTKEMFDKAFEHFGVNKEENTIDDDLHCPKCKSTNVSCACFGENDGCNCRDCNHSFMIHD